MRTDPATTPEEERARIVAFLRMLGEEVPAEMVAKLDAMKGSEVAQKSVLAAADHIEAGSHDAWHQFSRHF